MSRWAVCRKCHAILCESPGEPHATDHARHAETCAEPLVEQPWESYERVYRRSVLANLRASLENVSPDRHAAYLVGRHRRLFEDVRDEVTSAVRKRIEGGQDGVAACDAEIELMEPRTELGKRLLAIREKIVAAGESLRTWDEVEREAAERREDDEGRECMWCHDPCDFRFCSDECRDAYEKEWEEP